MIRSILTLFVASTLLLGSGSSCKKGGGGGSNPPPSGEAPLQVTTNPPNSSTQPASVEVDFPLRIMITSAIPAQGVTVDVTAKKDDGSGAAPFFSTSINTSASTIDVTITGTPLNVVCVVNITVTSRSTPTNKWVGSYRYSRK